MFDAPLGDDVLGEDPTVRRLEQLAATRFGKEAALFVVSGTMANQVAVLALCNHGDQVIVHRHSHIYNLEVSGLTTICGVQPRVVDAPYGRYEPAALAQEIQSADLQRSPTTLICLENTFDLNRGLAVPPEHIHQVCAQARHHGLRVYMDGARIFNAAVALGSSVAELSAEVDVVSACLSKGLACPVGSLILGPSDVIHRARRLRQRLGGGWRQAGVLAAAGLVALEEMVDRLAEDHRHARLLAEGLLELGLGINLRQVETNIVFIDLQSRRLDSAVFCHQLERAGVKCKPIGPLEARMVTHKDFHQEDVPVVLGAVAHVLAIISDPRLAGGGQP